MAAIDPNDLTVALGATPPGTPTTQAAFRTTRQILQDVVALMQLHGGGGVNPNPNPPVQNNPLPVGPIPGPIPQPRVGGIVMSNGVPTAWVGGGTGTALLTVPASAKAYRSQDLSLIMKTEKACTCGLPEVYHLPVRWMSETCRQSSHSATGFADCRLLSKNADSILYSVHE